MARVIGYSQIILHIEVRRGVLDFTREGLVWLNNTGTKVVAGCITNCSYASLRLDPEAFVDARTGTFSICYMLYRPRADENMAPSDSDPAEVIGLTATISGLAHTAVRIQVPIAVAPVPPAWIS